MPARNSLATVERFIAEPQPTGQERRAHPRETLFTAGLLVHADGRTEACIIVDRSVGGVRVKLDSLEPFPETFALIDLLSGLGYEGQTVWRKPPFAGARCLSRHHLRSARSGVGAQLKAIWRDALA